MKVSLNVAVHTTASEVYIRVRFQIYGQDSSFLIQRITFPHLVGDLRECPAVKEQLVDGSHRIGVLIRHQFPVLAVVAEDAVVAEVVLAALEAFPVSPFHIFRNGMALILRDGREEGKHHGAGRIRRVQVFLLEPHLYAVPVQELDVLLAVDNVPRKTGDRLYEDVIHLSVQCVHDHLLEARPVVRLRAGFLV